MAMQETRAGLGWASCEPVKSLQVSKKTGRRLERGLQYQPARQLELAGARTQQCSHCRERAGPVRYRTRQYLCLCLCLCPVR